MNQQIDETKFFRYYDQLPKQGSPDQTAPGSLEKGDRFADHVIAGLEHLRRVIGI